MLQALGMKFYDDEANEVDVTEGTRVLKYIRKIDASGLHPQLKDVRLQLMSDFDSKLYGKESEIIQLHEQLGLERNDAAEIDNLIWYLSEIFKSEMKLALGPITKGGAVVVLQMHFMLYMMPRL